MTNGRIARAVRSTPETPGPDAVESFRTPLAEGRPSTRVPGGFPEGVSARSERTVPESSLRSSAAPPPGEPPTDRTEPPDGLDDPSSDAEEPDGDPEAVPAGPAVPDEPGAPDDAPEPDDPDEPPFDEEVVVVRPSPDEPDVVAPVDVVVVVLVVGPGSVGTGIGRLVTVGKLVLVGSVGTGSGSASPRPARKPTPARKRSAAAALIPPQLRSGKIGCAGRAMRRTRVESRSMAAVKTDYYQVLGVTADASIRERRPGDIRVSVQLRAFEAHDGAPRLVRYRAATECEECLGAGFVAERDELCRACGGGGIVMTERQVRLFVPPGVEDGAELRVPREGHYAGPDSTSGDLVVEVRVLPPPTDRRIVRYAAFLLLLVAIGTLLVYIVR
jgi:hypothetical protein